MLVLKQSDFRKGIDYYKNAAYKLTHSAFNFLKQKGMLEEFYAIYPRHLTT